MSRRVKGGRMISRMRWLWFVAVLIAIFLGPPRLHAQEPESESLNWREEKVANFVIVYPLGEEAEAARYAAFVDQIYEDLATLFDHRVETPVTLRLYPTLTAYEEINPLAVEIKGVIAHAQLTQHEIAILVPRTVNLSDEEIANNIRHELTHLIVANLSDNRLPTGFHEGIAQYVEQPGPDAAAKVDLLWNAYQTGRLLSWSELNAGNAIYAQPDIGYPQAASIVWFLIDEYGFDRFAAFVAALRTAPGYRSALETTYGVPADQLEQAWLESLPAYMAGGWQVHALWAFDLSPIRELVEDGAYATAQSRIEETIPFLERSRQTEVLAEAQQLLATSKAGQEAGAATLAARDALLAEDYATARAHIAIARRIYTEIGDERHEAELSEMERWADDGLAALGRLAEADAAMQAGEFERAGELATEAGVVLRALGHDNGAEQSARILERIERRRQAGAAGLLGVGLLGLLANLLLRWRDRRSFRRQWAGGL